MEQDIYKRLRRMIKQLDREINVQANNFLADDLRRHRQFLAEKADEYKDKLDNHATA